MGFLDAKAAAAKTQARRKPVDSFSAAPSTKPFNQKAFASGLPRGSGESKERGEPQADRAVVVQVKIRDRAIIRTIAPGFEIGVEILEAVARWPQDFRDEWEERAALLEYDAGETRPVAERRAYELVREAHEAALLMEGNGE